MLVNFLKILLYRYKRKSEYRLFIKKWNLLNAHNSIIPKNIFPIERVKIGSYSYGELDVTVYNKNNTADILSIGNYVSISTNVKFFLDENHQTNTFTTFPLKSILTKVISDQDMISKGSIFIDDEVWIGNSAIILSGVNIGKGAIIATGAVVVSDVPPYSIVGGVPARILKYRFPQDVIDKLLPLRLASLSIDAVADNIDLFYQRIDSVSISKIEQLFKNNKESNDSY